MHAHSMERCTAMQRGKTFAPKAPTLPTAVYKRLHTGATVLWLHRLSLGLGAPTPPALICVVCIILARPTSDSFALPSLRQSSTVTLMLISSK